MIFRFLSLAALGAVLSGCGWLFGSQEERALPSVVISDPSNPMAVRASYLAGNARYQFLSTQQLMGITQPAIGLRNAAAGRRYDGVIIHGIAHASTQGFTRAVLVRDPVAYEADPLNPVYFVRLTPPAGPSPVGNQINREVLFAGFLPQKEATGVRSITLMAAQNRVTLRLR